MPSLEAARIESADEPGLVGQFETQVRGTPDHTAVVCEDRQLTYQELESAGLVKPDQPADHPQSMRACKHPTESQCANQVSDRISQYADLLDVGARLLEHLAVANPGWARRFARQAAEAKIKFLSKRLCDLKPAVSDEAHQRDPTSRAVSFKLGFVVGWAGRQAHAAMHALLHLRIVEILEITHRIQNGTGDRRVARTGH